MPVHASYSATAFGGSQENVRSRSGFPPSLRGLQVYWKHRVWTLLIFYPTASVKLLQENVSFNTLTVISEQTRCLLTVKC